MTANGTVRFATFPLNPQEADLAADIVLVPQRALRSKRCGLRNYSITSSARASSVGGLRALTRMIAQPAIAVAGLVSQQHSVVHPLAFMTASSSRMIRQLSARG